MHAWSNAAVLGLWEEGRGRTPVGKGLALLSRAAPELDADALAGVSIPRRDALVLAYRRDVLGARLPGIVTCPHCEERLEFEADADVLLATGSPAPESIRIGEHLFRLPNSDDLEAAAGVRDGTRRLVERCCLDAQVAWPEQAIADAEAGLAQHAGAANISFGFVCEACGAAWDSRFDVCAYMWEEVEARAEALLDDVHRLACAYGWDEPRILALSDARRGAYLARCDA